MPHYMTENSNRISNKHDDNKKNEGRNNQLKFSCLLIVLHVLLLLETCPISQNRSQYKLYSGFHSVQYKEISIQIIITIAMSSMESDLSFLIQNNKEVVVDKTYLQKCKIQQPHRQKFSSPNHSKPSSQVLSAGNIAVNPNYVPSWKNGSPRSINLQSNMTGNQSEVFDSSQQMFKISVRLTVLEENQRRIQNKFEDQFKSLQGAIMKKKGQYGDLMNEIKSIQNQINESKKVIGNVLNEITSKK